MLMRLLAFEIHFHGRQVVFRAAALIFFLLGFSMAPRGSGSASLAPNAPFSIIYLAAIMSLGSVILIALLAGNAVLRDREYKMEGIIFTTAVTHFQYVVSRFLGLVAAAFLVLCAFAAGLFLGLFMPWTDAQRLVPVQIWPYLWALLVVVLPNILVASSLIFATAALTRNSLATYISGIFLYIVYFAASMLGNSPIMAGANHLAPEQLASAALLEPFGLVGFMEQTRYWSVLDKNTRLPLLEGVFLFNRLLMTGFALSLFALTYRFFGFRTMAGPKTRAEQPPRETPAKVAYRPVAPTGLRHWRGRFGAFLAHTKICFRVTIFNYPFYALLLMWTFFTIVNLSEQGMRGDFGLPFYPFTGILLPIILEPLLKLGALVMVFYAGELVWSERKLGMDGLIDTCPRGNLTFWSAKIAALAWILICLIGWSILLAVLFQLYQGQGRLAWGLYLSLFLRAGVPLLLVGVLAVAIQTWIPNRYAGMAVASAAVILFSGVVLNHSPGIEHPMLRFAFTPEFRYSPMAGSGYHDPALYWFLSFWTAMAGLLALATLIFWRRGHGLRAVPLGRGGKLAASLSLVLALFAGGVIFYRTNVVRAYRSESGQRDHQADYERTYGSYEQVPTPTLVAVEVAVDLLPAERALTARGRLTFENQTGAHIDSVLIGFRPEVGEREVTLASAELMTADEDFGHYRYRFKQPLAPGGKGELDFSLRVARSAFAGLNPEIYVLPNASYVELEKVLPFFGFHSGLVLTDRVERRKRDLPERTAFPAASTAPQSQRDWVRIRAVVTTAAGQTVVAPGVLTGSWREGERSCFAFDTERPVAYGFGIASAVYEASSLVAGETEVSVYHAPGQGFNRDEMLAAAARALAYFRQNFGPYPFATLRVAELSSFSDTFGATAYAGTIFGVENRLFLLHQSEATLDLVGRGLAHEIGHQWWGQQIDPALVAGFRLLTEVLAEYSELVVDAQVHGRAGTLAFLEKSNDLYFYMRGFEDMRENPLSTVQNQPYIYYFKGAHAMYVLRELLGEARVNGVLRELLRDFAYPAKPTAADLIARLQAAATPEQWAYLDELFNQVVTYDLKTLSAKGESLADGETRVRAEIQASRTSLDAAGKASTAPFEGWIEVGLWRGDELVQTERVSLSAPGGTITLRSKQKPDAFSVDPRMLLLDADASDNRQKIEFGR